MPEINPSIREITVADGVNGVVSEDDTNLIYYILGTETLTVNWGITFTGTPLETMTCEFRYAANTTLGGNTVSILGTAMPDEYAAIQYKATAYYNGAAWEVRVQPDFEENNIIKQSHMNDDSVGTNELIDDSVTLAKLDSSEYTRGDLIYGNAAGDPALLGVGAAARILQSDGTDVSWVALSGDLTVAAGGAITIANTAVENTMINANVVGDGLTGGAGSAIDVEPDTTNGTSIAVGANGVQLTNDVTTPGVFYFYGTDDTGAGEKGWYAQSTISTLWAVGTGTESIQGVNSTNANDASGDYALAFGDNCTASGNYSIAGGVDNTATGISSVSLGKNSIVSDNYSTAIGRNHTVSGSNALALGYNCTASGYLSVAIGNGCIPAAQESTAIGVGSSTNSNANYSVALGAYAKTNSTFGYHFAFACNKWAADGDRQRVFTILHEQTTDDTPTNLERDAGSTDNITIPDDCTISFRIYVTAVQTAGVLQGDSFYQEFRGCVKRVNAAGAALVGAVTASAAKNDATFAGTVTMDVNGNDLRVRVTGEIGKNINWIASCELDLIGYDGFAL